jgi:hypothetical protein
MEQALEHHLEDQGMQLENFLQAMIMDLDERENGCLQGT